jgi:glycosyltransferase involved in cell wall biosynthesis
MDSVYAATDIVLHPSRRDAYPLVVIEAMSWSKPVIGSDVCGSVIDRVQHGYNGYSFPSGDVGALVELIASLAKDPSLAEAMGINARSTAEQWPLERGVEILKESTKRALQVS